MANQVTIRMQVAIGFAAMAATIAVVGVPGETAPGAAAAPMAMAAERCTTQLTVVDPPAGGARRDDGAHCRA